MYKLFLAAGLPAMKMRSSISRHVSRGTGASLRPSLALCGTPVLKAHH
ncbi:MAG: hypothetical protein LBS86_05410 [Treponema sp.]|nr:hypothetical protein [Treponema sp.]